MSQRSIVARAKPDASRTDDGDAFIADPGDGPARARDSLAEILAEGFVTSATSAQEIAHDDDGEDDAPAAGISIVHPALNAETLDED